MDRCNRPLNIRGRTGVSGRGVLGKWGPNHAADPVVTRWKRNELGEKVVHETSGKPILEFVCIQRRDTGGALFPLKKLPNIILNIQASGQYLEAWLTQERK